MQQQPPERASTNSNCLALRARRVMSRFLHAILLGLIAAGIVHIVILFLVPIYSERSAWAVLSEQGDAYTFIRLDQDGAPPLIPSIDPLFNAVACRFNLEEGKLRVYERGQSRGEIPYWSASVYDRSGQNLFSFNNNLSSDGTIDFVIASPVQINELRNLVPAEFDRSVFVEADTTEGIVVIRAFVPDISWEESVSSYLSGLSCTLY